MTITSSSPRRGAALVTTAIFLVVLISVSTVVIDQSVSHLRQETARAEATKLLVNAESAANIAIDWLQNNTSQLDRSTTAKTVTMATSLNSQPVSATFTYLGTATYQGTGETQDVYRVLATAATGAAMTANNANTFRRHQCEMLITPCPVTSIKQAMFAINGYDFTGSANTNSWNSNNGTVTYAAATKGSKGDLASEGTITVNNPGNVQGTVTSNASFPCPPVVYAPPTAYHSPDAITSNITLTAGTYRFRYIDISGDGAKITITGKVKIYVDGYCMIASKKSGSDPGNPLSYTTAASSLTIVQDNYNPATQPVGKETSFDLNSNSLMGNIDNPQQFQFMTAYTGEMKFNGNAEFGGVLYAPSATIQLNGGFEFYGAMIANTFNSKALSGPAETGKVNGNFNFHYDESLTNIPLDLPPRLAVAGWLSRALGVQ